MTKNFSAILNAFLFLFSLFVIGNSFGFHLSIYSLLLIPAVIMQVYAMIKAQKHHPTYQYWILLSTLTFLSFCLLRPDTDAHGPFTGYSALSATFGFMTSKHIEPWVYSLEACLLLILAQIFINTYILRGFGKFPK